MKTKRLIVKTNASKYYRASKKQRTAILDDLVKVTHYHRKHVACLIRNTGKVRYTPQGVKLVGDPTVTYMHKRGPNTLRAGTSSSKSCLERGNPPNRVAEPKSVADAKKVLEKVVKIIPNSEEIKEMARGCRSNGESEKR